MTRYTATITHHSIASARVIQAGDTLHAAKIAATQEFGGGMYEHVIVIMETPEDSALYEMPPVDVVVAKRRVGDDRWSNWA